MCSSGEHDQLVWSVLEVLQVQLRAPLAQHVPLSGTSCDPQSRVKESGWKLQIALLITH